jgi:hypothetical protein
MLLLHTPHSPSQNPSPATLRTPGFHYNSTKRNLPSRMSPVQGFYQPHCDTIPDVEQFNARVMGNDVTPACTELAVS